jgi:glycosyltransferase involved in cell wall biosynthesis
LKVLFLGAAHNSSWPGGEANVARILRSALSERGMDIHAACLSRSTANQKFLNLASAGPMSVVDSRIVNLYRRYIQKTQPNVVITCYDYDLSAFWASVLSGTPTIAQTLSPWPVCPKDDLFISTRQIRCEGPNLICGPCLARISENQRMKSLSSFSVGQVPLSVLSVMKMNKVKRMISKLNCASAIIADNLFLKNKMVQIGYDPQKVHMIYNGVNANKSKLVADEHKQKTVLFLAYQPTEHRRTLKGVHHFVQLARNLKPEFPDVQFLWVGQDGTQANDSFETRSYIWNEQELHETYESCYIFLLPSLWPETMSYAAQEAMAHGKPVVAYDTGANKEAIIHNETGMLAEWGNIEQLTSYVRALLLDEKAAKRIGNNARKLAQAKFSIERMAKSYQKIIEEIA